MFKFIVLIVFKFLTAFWKFLLFSSLILSMRGMIFLNFPLNLSFYALLIMIVGRLLFSFSMLRSILYIREKHLFYIILVCLYVHMVMYLFHQREYNAYHQK